MQYQLFYLLNICAAYLTVVMTLDGLQNDKQINKTIKISKNYIEIKNQVDGQHVGGLLLACQPPPT